ncbi:phage tail tape measure protein [Streptomyces sp. NBC_00557]|uniref:phage tail tape measure protein n=1 Tax=Streptomyces sp. NBC_00557 TaxID=2975776 RepID=UPI002E81FE46|nr:phage tail tape measure protein [Streptomyces sp. NBC_00557]WUC36408.1 phage tail tape measure protein [Streptomyces sp. NBC_00557]
MPNVGYATLQVIPSVRGISDELRRQLIGPAADAGQRAGEQSGGGFRDAFEGVLAALGVEAVAEKLGEQFTEAFNQAMEQSNIAGQLKAQLGATAKQAARYGQVAGSLYAKGVTDDLETAAEAVKATLQGGLVPPDATKAQLREIATEMADVSKTFGTDLGLQSQAVAAQLKNHLAPDAKTALDVIAKGFQTLGPNAEDLLETFQEYPVQLRKLGLDSKTTLGLFRQGIQGGARDTDILADALKEFSIRAVDGSATTIAGFKGLGLSAKGMAEQIGKGGDSARKGLDTVLDRLRKVKDPVKQSQLAVDLFGTQAEDLGKALFSLDPSKAVSAMGKVDGSAKQLGRDIRSGPAYEITTFTRSVRQAFVNILGGQVLPVLGKAGSLLNRTVLPPLVSVATVVGGTVIVVLKDLWSAGTAVVNWLRDMGTWLIPIGIAVAGFTAAILAQQIATAAVTAVFSIYRGAILAWTVVQRGATIAQAAFNAVMEANPVILVITAIVALAAALVVAYQRSETFRAIVQAAWAGIQTAALYVWNSVLKPTFAGLMTALSAIGSAFQWLWSSVISPVFSFISTAARILLTFLVVVVIAPIVLAVKALGAIFSWLWTNAISPVIGLITAGALLLWAGVSIVFGWLMTGLRTVGGWATWLWTNAISPVVGWITAGFLLLWAGVSVIFGWFTTGLRTVGGWATWLWTNAISPVVGWVVAGFGLMWTGVKVIFGWFTTGLRTVGGWAKWLWTNAVTPAINGVRSVISGVYHNGIAPVLSALRSAIGKTGDAFGAAKDAIGTAWSKVSAIAKKPVSFIIDTVYNHGIVAVWNKVASAFGAPKLSTYKFARGGPVFGAGTETSDDIPAWLSKNEHVWTAKEVRGAGGHGAVMALRKWAAAGGSGPLPGFKDGGGLFGWVGSAASAVKGFGSKAWSAVKHVAGWIKDGLEASARAGVKAVVDPLLSRIPGLNTGWGKAVKGLPDRAINAIFGYSKEADKQVSKSLPNIGGSGVSRWRPYVIKALAANGLSTSAAMVAKVLRQIATESGGNPKAVQHGYTDINTKTGDLAKGLMQTISATFNAYKFPGHDDIFNGYDNLLAALNYAKHRYGPSLSALGQGHGYATGTKGARRGWAWVGERGPELVLFGGGETVLDHQDSLRAALSMGDVGGYAKGTSAAARKQVPGDLSSVSKVLTASAADIKKAFDELTKDLKAAGGAGKALATSSSQASAKLQSLAKQRDSVQSKLAAAKQAATDQKKTASDFLGLSNLTDATSAAQLITGLQDRQATVKAFQSTITGLSKRGLSQDLISQLVAMGPDSALAGVVAGASKAQIAQLNQLAKSGAKLSTSYGNTMADAMFDAGKNASKGFLTGLQSQEKELQAEMNKLGDTLVKSIKHKLGIHSPAKALMPVGANTALGVVAGMDDTTAKVTAAAARLADAAVPEAPSVSPASYTTTAQAHGGALASGQRLYLVLEDGTAFPAYVDQRADGRVAAGMRQVRRKVRAGTK